MRRSSESFDDNRDASLDDVAGALIQAVEAAERPYQDNTTVLLFAPEADCGEETIPEDAGVEEANPDEETPASPPEGGLSGFWTAFKEKLTRSPAPQSEPVDAGSESQDSPTEEKADARSEKPSAAADGATESGETTMNEAQPCATNSGGAFLLSALRQEGH